MFGEGRKGLLDKIIEINSITKAKGHSRHVWNIVISHFAQQILKASHQNKSNAKMKFKFSVKLLYYY